MDLSFAQNRPGFATALPIDLAVLLVGVATRQAASPTARRQAMFVGGVASGDLLRPASGAFDVALAAALTRWKGK